MDKEKASIVGSEQGDPTGGTFSSTFRKEPFETLERTNRNPAPTDVANDWKAFHAKWSGKFEQKSIGTPTLLNMAAAIAVVLGYTLSMFFIKRRKERLRSRRLLRESEERFKLAIENTQAGLWDWNIKTGEIISSPEWSTMLGYAAGSITHISQCESIYHPDDLPEARRRLQDHFIGTTPFYEFEHRLRHHDGHWIWVICKGKVVQWDQDGKPVRMIGTNIDITARVRTEEKLRLIQFAVDNACDEVYQADMQGRILYVNHQACRNLGYEPCELVGSPIQLFNPVVSEEQWGRFWQNLPHEKVMYSETLHRRKDGSLYPVEVSANYASYDGKEYSIAFIRDITRRKEAEEELKLYRLMIDKSRDPFFIFEIDGSFRMMYVNDAAVDHFGVARDAILAWQVSDWEPVIHDKLISGQLEEIQKTGSLVFESVHHVKGGVDIPVEISLNLIRYKGRDCYFGYFKNITERKAAESALRLSKEIAEQSARFKSQFLAHMSHEIRTPMNGVIGLAQMALAEQMSDGLRNYLSKILSSSQSLLGILNDILDISKIEAGRMHIESSRFDLDDLLDTLRNLFAHHAQQKGIMFCIAVARETPRELFGDVLRLQQVLSNLLGNAIKFTDEGYVALKISSVRNRKNQSSLLFRVEDSGIGLSEQDIDQLFKPFSQVGDSNAMRSAGTGLGLAISQNLIHLMGGELKLTSRVGEGSCFSFELELGIAGDRTERKFRPKTEAVDNIPRPAAQSAPNQARIRLLVAEDNEVNQIVAKGLLERSGFAVTLANNGKEALDLLGRQPFDAVLMDMQMPVMDGLEATRNIRKQEQFSELPIIALTAGVTREERDRCLAAGMNDFASKPINTTELTASLLKWVARKE
ncbi:MAG: PAS domain S-box protein [Gammaproteobacteria bacterium]